MATSDKTRFQPPGHCRVGR